MTCKHTTTVRTPAEYRAALKAADTLGLELKRVTGSGAWDAADGDAVFLTGLRDVEIHNVGRTYFHIPLSDDTPQGRNVYPVRPVRGRTRDRDGHLTLYFH